MRNGITILLIFLLIFTSCASHTDVYTDPMNIQSVIIPGDKVKIVTQDDQEIEFVVTEVTNEAIIGENIVVPLNDIIDMEQETVSAGKNFLIITLITLASAAGAAAGSYNAFSSGTNPAADDIFEALDDIPGWVKGCTKYYPPYHPGDFLALESAGLRIKHIGIDESICIEKCKTAKCNSVIENSRKKYFKGMETCNELLRACKFKCIEKGHPIGEIAKHIEGGYYSDGSYYATCKSDNPNLYLNLHPTNEKYEKTKWQKDRDECMKLTIENVKPSFWEKLSSTELHEPKYYKECLNERGYSITIY